MNDLNRSQILYLVSEKKRKALQDCEKCDGTGKCQTDDEYCSFCSGTGKKDTERYCNYKYLVIGVRSNVLPKDLKEASSLEYGKTYGEIFEEYVQKYEVDGE